MNRRALEESPLQISVHVHACARACVRACVCACVHACVCVCVCVRWHVFKGELSNLIDQPLEETEATLLLILTQRFLLHVCACYICKLRHNIVYSCIDRGI